MQGQPVEADGGDAEEPDDEKSVEVLKQDTFVAATAQAAADLRKWASTRKTASQLNLQDMDRSGRP